MRIRGGAGLGDSIYLRVIAEHFRSLGEDVIVCSDYPDVFIGADVKVEAFSRDRIDRLCHYTVGKTNPRTTQFQDMLDSAGIPVAVELRVDWKIRNDALVQDLEARSDGRPIILVHGGRVPMGRKDNFGREIMPDERGFKVALGYLVKKYNAFLVRIGMGPDLYKLDGHIHYDLNDRTTVPDLFDLSMASDGIVAQCSFAVPLAEVFDTPLLAVCAHAGMAPGVHMFVRQITPAKILQKPMTSRYFMDDWSSSAIESVVEKFQGTMGYSMSPHVGGLERFVK